MAVRNPLQTRTRLLNTAFQEMHAHGFQGMRVDEVLRQAGLHKGAFYHHFGSKTALGYAVLEEQIKPLLESLWLAPLGEINDPVTELPQMLEQLSARMPIAMRAHGCPLNNLAQEMASQDQGFQDRIAQLFTDWFDAFAEVFAQAQSKGYIRVDVDRYAVARFLVALLEGCIGIAKVEQDSSQWTVCRSQLAFYLETLRPQTVHASGQG